MRGFLAFCLFVSLSAAASAAYSKQSKPVLLRGGDVSEIPEVEASGGVFLLNGHPTDPFEIMRKAGWNFVRFRVWNHPQGGYCDLSHTLDLAKRAKAVGMKISIDLHYSDWWADPGKQNKPAAWKTLSFEGLNRAVHDFTRDVVKSLIDQGTPPEMVQIGNEITGGTLWPDGRVSSDEEMAWRRLAQLLDSGIQGVHDAGDSRIKTMIHLDRGGDSGGATWWFDHIVKEKVQFDLIGLSFYPFWHGSVADLQANLNGLAKRYGKDIYVVETGYPWTLDVSDRPGDRVFADEKKLLSEYPATPEGQANFLRAVEAVIEQVHGGHGRGLLYWAPTWISAPRSRSPYDNLALFDYQGNALPSMQAIGNGK
jgi:arabinogalactan endo-1,4-beta-galactosidase